VVSAFGIADDDTTFVLLGTCMPVLIVAVALASVLFASKWMQMVAGNWGLSGIYSYSRPKQPIGFDGRRLSGRLWTPTARPGGLRA